MRTAVLRARLLLPLIVLGVPSLLAAAPEAEIPVAKDELAVSIRRAKEWRSGATPRALSSRLQRPVDDSALLLPLEPLPTEDGLRRVTVRFDPSAGDARVMLERNGLLVEAFHQAEGLAEGRATESSLGALAQLAFVNAVRPLETAILRSGSVTTEGSAGARADELHAGGYRGQGVVVGVISDGIDHYLDARRTGDLPAVTVPGDSRCRRGAGDEGTALLEIVHDVAPESALLFSGPETALQMIEAVRCLSDAGADVIVDDLGFPGEPFFEDGPVARAIRAAVQAGVSYHTSAGNDGESYLEQDYRSSPTTSFHDFNGGPVDNTNSIILPPFSAVQCVLQWNDLFGRSGNDYDLYFVDSALRVVAESSDVQSGSGDPIESTGVVNPAGFSQLASVVIDRFSGGARRLKLLCFGGSIPEYTDDRGSIYGHAALTDVVTVGAIDAADPGLDTVESFSSRGPVTITFPSSESRAKPDIVALDGVSITNAGDFPSSCPPRCKFFGTSAASPHSAGVAALLLSKNPFAPPDAIRAALRNGSHDLPPAGFDPVSGAGRLDAVASAGQIAAIECRADQDCSLGSACSSDTCAAGVCSHTAVTCPNDGTICNGSSRCEPAVGCVDIPPPTCVDGDPCTADGCHPTNGCSFVPLTGSSGASCHLDQAGSVSVCGSIAVDSKTKRKIGQAFRLAHRAQAERNAAKLRVKIKRLRAQVQALQKRVAKIVGRSKLDPSCGTRLLSLLEAAACTLTPGCTPSTTTSTTLPVATTSTTSSTLSTTSSTLPIPTTSSTVSSPSTTTTSTTTTTLPEPTTTSTTAPAPTSSSSSSSTSSTSTSTSIESTTTSTTLETTTTSEPTTTSSTSTSTSSSVEETSTSTSTVETPESTTTTEPSP